MDARTAKLALRHHSAVLSRFALGLRIPQRYSLDLVHVRHQPQSSIPIRVASTSPGNCEIWCRDSGQRRDRVGLKQQLRPAARRSSYAQGSGHPRIHDCAGDPVPVPFFCGPMVPRPRVYRRIHNWLTNNIKSLTNRDFRRSKKDSKRSKPGWAKLAIKSTNSDQI